jgi:hypothetical protein
MRWLVDSHWYIGPTVLRATVSESTSETVNLVNVLLKLHAL